MEKKLIEAVAPLPRRATVILPPHLALLPASPPSHQDRSVDIDSEILDWILSHVRNRKPPRTSLMSVSVLLTGVGLMLCAAAASIGSSVPPI
jgi:hypothetical protein